MRAIEIKITDKLFEVVGYETIREHSVQSIRTGSDKDFKKGKKSVVIKSKSDHEYFADLNSNVFVNIRWNYKLFTTLEAAQKHQLRMRKSELFSLLQNFKKARNKYEEFKQKYKNAPASKPE